MRVYYESVLVNCTVFLNIVRYVTAYSNAVAYRLVNYAQCINVKMRMTDSHLHISSGCKHNTIHLFPEEGGGLFPHVYISSIPVL